MGGGAKLGGHNRAGVCMNSRGGVKSGESGLRVGIGGDLPWEDISPSARRDGGLGVTVCAILEVEAGYS